MDFTLILEKSILAVVIFGITLVVAMYSTYAERKVAAFLQDRIGPNRAGPFGLLQPLADGVKFFMKEEIIPTSANRFLFVFGPSLAMLTACLTSAVIPWSQPLNFDGRIIPLQVANINIGILYMFGLVSVGVYGIMIGGWASNNKYSLIGAIRASSQMISYELGMGLSIIAMIMVTGSLNLNDIIAQQRGFNWNIWYQPLGFLIFLVCAFAECNRAPFDLPESETDLVGGYHTEYSSMKLGFYLFAEYINMFVSSALMAALFLGGYNFPFMDSLGLSPNMISVIGVAVFFAKIFFLIFFFMWVRWTLPRFRYDQVMKLGWQILIPLSLVNILLTGGVLAFYDKF
ncbi:MAG: NADH-quinone oxidoreductase subunit NuoH [Sphingobacteriales bacterium]|nr:MAG: NADH-quinone oxidoreductase subunit NuoH [Sphingobacteriales bacterium]